MTPKNRGTGKNRGEMWVESEKHRKIPPGMVPDYNPLDPNSYKTFILLTPQYPS